MINILKHPLIFPSGVRIDAVKNTDGVVAVLIMREMEEIDGVPALKKECFHMIPDEEGAYGKCILATELLTDEYMSFDVYGPDGNNVSHEFMLAPAENGQYMVLVEIRNDPRQKKLEAPAGDDRRKELMESLEDLQYYRKIAKEIRAEAS